MRTAIVLLMLAVPASADDVKTLPADHPATKRWDESKETYSRSIEAHKKTLLKLIRTVEDRARADGDTERVKQIVAERDAFEKIGTLPKSVKTATYEKDLEAARNILAKEAKTAKAAFLTAKLDDAAGIVEAEAKALVGIADEQNATKTPASGKGEWKSTSGNRWIHQGGDEWKEVGGVSEDRVWTEIARGSNYLELQFQGGDGFLRLYRDHADFKSGGGGYAHWGQGRWVTLPEKSAGRIYWKGHQGSIWEKQPDGKWSETDANGGKNLWTFAESTDEYVQLRDRSRKLTFRMYADRAELSMGGGVFMSWGAGKWSTPPEAK